MPKERKLLQGSTRNSSGSVRLSMSHVEAASSRRIRSARMTARRCSRCPAEVISPSEALQRTSNRMRLLRSSQEGGVHEVAGRRRTAPAGGKKEPGPEARLSLLSAWIAVLRGPATAEACGTKEVV